MYLEIHEIAGAVIIAAGITLLFSTIAYYSARKDRW